MLSKLKKIGLGVAAATGAAVGGAAVAGAATSHSGTATAGRQPPPARNMPAPGTASHEDSEKAVTGDAATKAQAAAVKAAGGGTAGDVTTDYFGTGYEVTVTKSDGSEGRDPPRQLVQCPHGPARRPLRGPAPGWRGARGPREGRHR